MFKSIPMETKFQRLLRGTVGMSPVFALVIASQPSVAQAATLPASNLVSACSGVSLPASAVTSIIAPVLTGTITPLQSSLNGVLASLLGSPTTFNLTGLLSTATSGQPITLQALNNNGTVIGPSGPCYSQATGFTLTTPAGLSIGGNQITGLGTGATATAGEINSIALGNGASTSLGAASAVAIGNNAAVNLVATGGVAIGNGAAVSQANSVALGAGSTALRGALTGYTGYALTAPQTSAGEVSIGVAGGERQLTNVAAGSAATDAVNVAQLTAVNGQVASNTTAIAANASALGTLSNLAVQYTDPTHTSLVLGGTASAPVALTNVQAVPLTATSTAAVNGSQLFTTNANVTTNANAINALSNLAVQYTDPTHASVTLGGTGSAPVALTNVQAAPLTATSTAAVNGGQLFTTNANVAANTASLLTQGGQINTLSNLAVEYTDPTHASVALGGTGAAPVALTNVQAVPLTATSTAAVNGGQLFATNANVATNAASLLTQGAQITTNTNAIGTLSNLAVQYTDATHAAVTLGGTGSAPVALTNVQATPLSATSTAAVNGSQLFATNANVTANANAVSALSNLAVQYTDPTHASVTLGGTGAAPVALTNVQAAPLTATSTAAVNGGQLFTTNANVAANTASLLTQGGQINTLSNLAVEYTDPTHASVALGGTGAAPVALTNVQAVPLTATSTAAVNGGQLFATNANVAANAAGLLAQGGQITANTNAIGTLSDLAVQYTDPTHTTVTLGGAGAAPVVLANVQAVSLTATSTAAVNGSQLFATNADVAANTALLTTQGSAIGVNANAIVALRQDTTDGAIGPVQYSNPLTPTTPNGGTPTNDLTLVGAKSAPVALHNVAAGLVAAGSTDGVNGGQLFALGNQIGSLSDLAVEYNDATKTSISLGNGTTPVLLTNVRAGTLGETSTDAVNGSQLFATDTDVAANGAAITANTSAIGSLRTATANGAIGPLQYSTTLLPTTPTGGTVTNDVTLTGASGGPVGLHNVAAGSLTATSTDAVNGSQLYALNAAIGTASTLGVLYDDAGHSSVTFGGTGSAPVALHNVAPATLTATSTDAVNGSQLFATNAQVSTNSADIASLTTTVGDQGTALTQDATDIAANAQATATLRTDVGNGAVGPVQYSFAATPTTPNGGTPTNDLTLVGARNAPVALHNVAAGSVTDGSTDAVNGGQLYALTSSVGTLSGLAVQYDDATRTRITLSSAAGAPVALTGVAAADLSATSTDAVNGAQLYATNQNVASLSADIGNGSVGPVRYSSSAAPTTPDNGVASQDLTLVGAASGPVGLHNVAAGSLTATSTDAVNGSQLYATNQNVANISTTLDSQTTELSSLNTAVTNNNTAITQTNQALTQLDTSITNGGIGPVQYSSTGSTTTPNGGTPSQDLTLVGAGSGPVALHNLAAGSLALGSTDAVNGSQLGALGVATANVFGGTYAYDPATNSYSGSFSYGGNSYTSIQAALGAIQTSVADTAVGDVDGTGIKYFHTTSSMADSSATGTNSTAIGPSSVSSGSSSIAVGQNAVAAGDSSVAIGTDAMAQNGEAVSIGVANFASGNGAVSIGDPNSATGDGAIALGMDNTAQGDGSIALGNTNSATGLGAAAVGDMNSATGDGAAAIGYQNSATGVGSIAIGSNNVANGNNSLAIGTNVQTTAADTLAIGSNATSSGTSSVTVGNRAIASGASGVAVGDDAHATAALGSAFGNQASASGGYGVAVGAMSAATGFASTAVGAGANVTGFASTALGTGSIASNDGSVALGSASQTTRGPVADYNAFGLDADQSSAGEIAVARNISYTDPVTGLPTMTGNRQITGVAAGSADTDAVNVSQLRGVSNSLGAVIAAGLGGGSAYNTTTGQLTAPSYTFGGVTYTNVGSALAALASNETGTGGGGTGTGTGTGTGGSVTYTDPSHATVTLASTGTTIQNVAPGAVTATSTDAVNGSQLAATNAAVATNTSAINTLSTQVANGAVGVVRYSSSSAPNTPNGGTQSNDATLVGANASAPVALHNVAAGNVATGSTDAVNGDQLASTNRAVATAQTTANTALAQSSNSLQYDTPSENSVTLGNASSGAVAVHNVAPGISPNDAANVGQVNAAMAGAVTQANNYTDGRIAALSFNLRNVQRDSNAGAAGAMALAGMPQPYEAGKGMVSMGAGTFQGQTAIAMGVAKALNDGHTVIKLGATYNSRGMVGGNAGIGWQF